MPSKPHHAHTFHTFAEYFRFQTETFDQNLGMRVSDPSLVNDSRYRRHLRRTWKQHVEKNGNVPLVTQCGICSGDEFRRDVKSGRFKPARPTKGERDEIKTRNVETDLEVI